MGKISVLLPTEVETVRAIDTVAEERKSYLTADELASQQRRYFPRDGESMQLFESTLVANTVINSHAHTEDEIIYVVSGALHVGRRVLPAGSALFIEKDTLYTFRAGPEGCTFLNFRGVLGATYLTKAALADKRKAEASA
jgi:quercetin dioxygenase-like cupin family protein